MSDKSSNSNTPLDLFYDHLYPNAHKDKAAKHKKRIQQMVEDCLRKAEERFGRGQNETMETPTISSARRRRLGIKHDSL